MSTENQQLARRAGGVSAATTGSRILGLVREQVFAYLFGAGLATDAFIAAFRIPNLLRDLFAEGAMSAAFVPAFSKKLSREGKQNAFPLFNLVGNALVVVLTLVVLVGIFFTPAIVSAIAPGFEKIAGKAELTAFMAQIMFPYLVLVALAALTMGVLNSLGHFTWPAFSSAFLNIGMIGAGFLLCPFFDPPIVGMAYGVLFGGLLQWAVQMPSLRKEGYRYRPVFSFRHPELLAIAGLIIPALAGIASTEINIFVNTQIASLMPEGAVSYLNYAFRLMHFPLGVFGVALATVSLPTLSQKVAANDLKGVGGMAASALGLVFFLNVPASLFLIVAAVPVVSVLFQHGQFGPNDTLMTASALQLYSLGLLGYSGVRVLAPVFYAFADTKTPVKVGILAVFSNIILNVSFYKLGFGFRWLAFSASVSAFVNFFVLLYLFRKKLPEWEGSAVWSKFWRIGLAALVPALVCWGALAFFYHHHTAELLWQQLLVLALSFLLFSGLYLIITKLLKVEETGLFATILRRMFVQLKPR
ncbi:MAG TPA: murein biosynthesis integral membrane protein MurJ [candidate division Zixibacteria bacterium]|nr:murein biosynthesis integral membrane protein MurJ [candidate division Zixibacteria bacterium]